MYRSVVKEQLGIFVEFLEYVCRIISRNRFIRLSKSCTPIFRKYLEVLGAFFVLRTIYQYCLHFSKLRGVNLRSRVESIFWKNKKLESKVKDDAESFSSCSEITENKAIHSEENTFSRSRVRTSNIVYKTESEDSSNSDNETSRNLNDDDSELRDDTYFRTEKPLAFRSNNWVLSTIDLNL